MVDSIDDDLIALLYSSEPPTEQVLALVSGGADVNTCDEDGLNALSIACTYPVEPWASNAVQVLLDSGAELEARDWSNMTPLMHAARYGTQEAVSALLVRGASATAECYEGLTALMHAAEENSAGVILCLVGAISETAALTEALLAAAGRNEPDVLTALISAGADVEGRLPEDSHYASWASPLLQAATLNRLGAVSALVEAGADMGKRDMNGRTAVMLAAAQNTPDVVAFLLDTEVAQDVLSPTDPSELLPFAITLGVIADVGNSSDEMVPWLIERGADAGSVKSILYEAMFHLCGTEIVRALIHAGASLEDLSKNGSTSSITPLIWATCSCSQAMVELLLDAGANVNAADSSGQTPLHHVAARFGDPNLLMRMVEMGSNVNAVDLWGNTALLEAAKNTTNPEMVECLLEAGANPQARDGNGLSAADHARENPALANTAVRQQLAQNVVARR